MEQKDSPYYMGNRELPPIVLETEYGEKVITHELPWDMGEEHIMPAFYSSLSIHFGNIPTLKMFEDYAKRVAPQVSANKFALKDNFRLSLKSENAVSSIVIKPDWCTSNFDVMEAFRGALLAQGWDNDSIYDMIGEFVIDYLPKEKEKEN